MHVDACIHTDYIHSYRNVAAWRTDNRVVICVNKIQRQYKTSIKVKNFSLRCHVSAFLEISPLILFCVLLSDYSEYVAVSTLLHK